MKNRPPWKSRGERDTRFVLSAVWYASILHVTWWLMLTTTAIYRHSDSISIYSCVRREPRAFALMRMANSRMRLRWLFGRCFVFHFQQTRWHLGMAFIIHICVLCIIAANETTSIACVSMSSPPHHLTLSFGAATVLIIVHVFIASTPETRVVE